MLLVPLLLVMTGVTGVVDAVSILGLGHIFVANMTGNVAFLAFAVAGASGFSVSASLVAVAAFLAGAAVGTRAVASARRRALGRSCRCRPPPHRASDLSVHTPRRR